MNAFIAPATPSNDASPTLSSDADRYRAILETKIRQGREQAARVLERIEQDQPRDQMVPASVVRFEPCPAHGVVVEVADDQYTPTDFALGQIAARAGVPGPYLRELVDIASLP